MANEIRLAVDLLCNVVVYLPSRFFRNVAWWFSGLVGIYVAERSTVRFPDGARYLFLFSVFPLGSSEGFVDPESNRGGYSNKHDGQPEDPTAD